MAWSCSTLRWHSKPVLQAISERSLSLLEEVALPPGDALSACHALATTLLCLVQAFTDLEMCDDVEAYAEVLQRLGEKMDEAVHEKRPGNSPQTMKAEAARKLPQVLWETVQLQVLLKPPGWTVGAGSAGQARSMERWFQERCSHGIASDAEADFGFVHRLDRNTSGLLLCAKTYAGYFAAKFEFNARRVKKQYLALCQGHFPKGPAMLDFPLQTSEIAPGIYQSRVDQTGQSALTEVLDVAHLMDSGKEAWSLVALKLHTGRTHQIRAHCSHLGHPLAGDEAYGASPSSPSPRVFLHAFRLEIKIETVGAIARECPLLGDLLEVLQHLQPASSSDHLQMLRALHAAP